MLTLAPQAAKIPNSARHQETKVPQVSEERGTELEQERALCAQAQAGDRDALASLLRLHGPRLYRSVLLPRLGSRVLAEDALSATYTKVVEKIAQFSWQSVGFYPWLRSVGLHVAIDQLRKRRRECLFEPNDLERELEHQSDPSGSAEAIEQHDLDVARERVQSLLRALNPRYALAIRLRILEDVPRESAAQTLGVSVSTFDVVLHRAMAALKKALAESGGAL
jgi:RNA polymerase sigma-70 factor (ECF subfamily)